MTDIFKTSKFYNRFKTIGDTSLAAAWSEQGSVGIWSLDHCLQKVEQPGVNSDKDQREATSPLFNFKGHQTEGFAMNWSPTMPGVLATGEYFNRNLGCFS